MIQQTLSVALLWACYLPMAYGFVVQPQVVGTTLSGAHVFATILLTRSNFLLATLNDSVSVPDATMLSSSSLMTAEGGAMEIVKNVVIAIAALFGIMFVLGALTTIWVIPQAAKQLEEQTKLIDPALWEEYEKQLGPDEVLAMRPDLMQALGEKVQQKMAANFDAAMARQEQAKKAAASTTTSSNNSRSDDDGVIDVTIKKE
jgi:hypothetical protein